MVGKPPGGMPEKDLNTIVGALSEAPQFIPSRYLWLSVCLKSSEKIWIFWVIRSGQRLNKQKTLISVLGK